MQTKHDSDKTIAQTIDYVVPMVFSEDSLWQEDFKKYALPNVEGSALLNSWSTGRKLIEVVKKNLPWIGSIYQIFKRKGCSLWQRHTQRNFTKSPDKFIKTYPRWRSWGTERQLIQLVRKNLPWVRNIYVILARESQRQDWMNDEKIKVIYHKDFIPHKYLPTFSSNTIEMYLHKIPGISEYFIYANDDMFPLSPMDESDFFVDDKPCQHMDEKDFPENPNVFQKRCKNAQSFVANMFDKGMPEKWLINGHSLAPIKKTTCEEIWEKGGKKIEASISTLRSEKSFSQFIYSWWQHYSGDYVDKSFPIHYVESRNITAEELSALIKKTKGVLCINDGLGVNDYASLSKAAREALDIIIQENLMSDGL